MPRTFALIASALLAAGAALADGPEGPIFDDVSLEVGLDFVHWNGMSGELYFPEITGQGVALFDADGDGDLDLYLVQGAWLGPEGKSPTEADPPPPEARPRDRLYRNDLEILPDGGRRLHLVDVTEASGIDARGYGMGVATGDADGDGDLDLYLTNVGSNQLWRNDGPDENGVPRFTDVTREAGADDDRWSVAATFVDVDGDGDLDLYLTNYVDFALDRRARCYATSSRRDYCGPDTYPPVADRLLRNLGPAGGGGIHFEDVSAAVGLHRAPQPGLGVAAADFDGDGRAEILVANDGRPNQLWKLGPEGESFDDALLAGLAVNREGQSEASMGIAVGDFDNDGDEDVFLTHLDDETNTLLVNDGGLFEDRTVEQGLASPSLPLTAFGTGWVDVDNDGWLDLAVLNGAVRLLDERVRQGDPYPLDQHDQLFRNLGGERFEEITERAGEVFERLAVSRGLALGDVDNDGDTDLLTSESAGPARLFLNRIGQDRPWLGLRLLGGDGEKVGDVFLAEAILEREGAPDLLRVVRTDGSYASASDPRLLFGLGSATGITAVKVTWPGGEEERFAAPPLETYTTLYRGRGQSPPEKESNRDDTE